MSYCSVVISSIIQKSRGSRRSISGGFSCGYCMIEILYIFIHFLLILTACSIEEVLPFGPPFPAVILSDLTYPFFSFFPPHLRRESDRRSFNLFFPTPSKFFIYLVD